MEELTVYKDYKEYKQTLDAELQQAAERFVKIGYLLKIARDTDILSASGYRNVNDFAQVEYGIDKTMVNRWININDRFAENGYSDQLKAEYRGYGYAKLAIMLTLPESITEELTPNYSKSEILEIKAEVDKAAEIAPMETYLEGEDKRQQDMDSLLTKAVHQLLHDEIAVFKKIWAAVLQWAAVEPDNNMLDEVIMDALAPAGDSIHSIRIAGVGRFLLSTKEDSEYVALTNARSGEKEMYTWREVIKGILFILGNYDETADYKDKWEEIYQEEFPMPQEPENAPVQQQQERKEKQKKTEQKGKSKIKKPEKVFKAKEPEPLLNECNIPEALPGQREISDYPEYAPKAESTDPENVGQEEGTKIIVSDMQNAGNEGEDTKSFLRRLMSQIVNDLRGNYSGVTELDEKYITIEAAVGIIESDIEEIIEELEGKDVN